MIPRSGCQRSDPAAVYLEKLKGGNHFGDHGVGECVSECISEVVVTLR
jgi:hypothetical protein